MHVSTSRKSFEYTQTLLICTAQNSDVQLGKRNHRHKSKSRKEKQYEWARSYLHVPLIWLLNMCQLH